MVPGFVDGLPCRAVVAVANNLEMVNRFCGPQLSVLARSEHIWKCLPIKLVKHLAKNAPNIGSRAGLVDLVSAARLMAKSRGRAKARSVVPLLLSHQVTPLD